MLIPKTGIKVKEWLKAKDILIVEYQKKGITKCENCGSRLYLSFHHRPKRSSQEAKHDFEHTRLVCQECHNLFEYNEELDKRLFLKLRGYDLRNRIYPMAEEKTKKTDWQKRHECVHCKKMTVTLICQHCGKMSIK